MPARERPQRSFLESVQFVWLNVWFWTIAPLFTLIFAVGAAVYVCLFLGCTLNRRRTQRIIRRSIAYYGAAVLRCAWPMVKVKYIDYEPGTTPPLVFVCNHRSSSDAYLVAFVRHESIHVLNIWASRIPLLGFVANIAGYLKVREISFEEFIRLGSKLLSEGCSIIAFPEGTRSGSTELNQFHGSVFRLAQQNRVPVVPLAIIGSENIPRRGTALLNPGRVEVAKLPAFTPAQYEQWTPFKFKTLARERIRDYLNTRTA